MYDDSNKGNVVNYLNAIIIWTSSLSLTKTDLRSPDFVANRLFMRLFKTTDINVVETCQQYAFRFVCQVTFYRNVLRTFTRATLC